MKKLKLKVPFNLHLTINSGQIFLFKKINDFYYIVNGKNIFKVKQDKHILYYDFISKKDLIYFFNLDFNLQKIYDNEKNNFLKSLYKNYFGLGIINQDFFMCIICFICSQNTSIKKNTKSLNKMCEIFGEKKIIDNNIFYTFPTYLNILQNEKEIKKCSFGYREKYIINLCEKIKNEKNFLQNLKTEKNLLNVFGVGEKVFCCIALFSLKKYDYFPKDVWIKRSLKEIFKVSNKEEEDNLIENFGEYRGIKQQYIFEYMRKNYLK